MPATLRSSLSAPRLVPVRGERPTRAGAALGGLWILAAFVALALATWRDGALPLFAASWLLIPLAALIRHGDPGRLGLRMVGAPQLMRVTTAAALATACLTIAAEPWSGAYGRLVDEALATEPVDTTFGWLVLFDGIGAWAGFVLFSGLVTIFAEELFFRGWLLQLLCRHTGASRAICAQAALFSLPQALAAVFLSPVQAAVYVVVYAFAVIGLVGGYAAWRTASIWPSLILATTLNATLTYFAT